MKRFEEYTYTELIKNWTALKLDSDMRLQTFRQKGCQCIKCGLKGSVFALEQSGNRPPHINLYAQTSKGEIMMTVDHIFPKSKGGTNTLDNYQPMCQPCNLRKGNKC